MALATILDTENRTLRIIELLTKSDRELILLSPHATNLITLSSLYWHSNQIIIKFHNLIEVLNLYHHFTYKTLLQITNPHVPCQRSVRFADIEKLTLKASDIIDVTILINSFINSLNPFSENVSILFIPPEYALQWPQSLKKAFEFIYGIRTCKHFTIIPQRKSL